MRSPLSLLFSRLNNPSSLTCSSDLFSRPCTSPGCDSQFPAATAWREKRLHPAPSHCLAPECRHPKPETPSLSQSGQLQRPPTRGQRAGGFHGGGERWPPPASRVPAKVHCEARSCSVKQEQELNTGKSVSLQPSWEKEPEAATEHAKF